MGIATYTVVAYYVWPFHAIDTNIIIFVTTAEWYTYVYGSFVEDLLMCVISDCVIFRLHLLSAAHVLCLLIRRYPIGYQHYYYTHTHG